MRVAVGADHAGFPVKAEIAALVARLGHEVDDHGTHSTEACDYPDTARSVAEAVAAGRADRGLLICGSGLGASIAANKVPGARAGNCSDRYSAHQGVEHDDMNILVFGARVIGIEVAKELVEAFLAARFSGEERHVRRLNKVKAIEAHYSKIEP
ncbi:MAG: ribose 5-phosphate isomerase B [Fimbriimonadaceae bacterium]|nr:ribose 5-phosphate isomerase B [Fimbriimonadaceae bacterium]